MYILPFSLLAVSTVMISVRIHIEAINIFFYDPINRFTDYAVHCYVSTIRILSALCDAFSIFS
jgi:hypothetical protein